jgi:ribonuclease HI
MPLPPRAEILAFIAKNEPLEMTLREYPGITREHVRALLREAALLMRAEEQGVPEQSAPAAAEPTEPPPPRPDPSTPEPVRFLRLFSDGAARGNPGPAGAGAVLTKADGTPIAKLGKFLGTQTNNHAEYMGLLLGLEAAIRLGANELEVVADSELLVRQLQGAYRVKSPGLRPLHAKAQELLGHFQRVRLRHVPREENKLADEMSNRAIDEKM